MRRLKPTTSTQSKQKTFKGQAISWEAAFVAVAVYLEENDDGQVKLSELVRLRDVTLPIK